MFSKTIQKFMKQWESLLGTEEYYVQPVSIDEYSRSMIRDSLRNEPEKLKEVEEFLKDKVITELTLGQSNHGEDDSITFQYLDYKVPTEGE